MGGYLSLYLYSSLIFQFLSFLQGTAHRVTELLAGRLGRDKVILNHPVASIKQVKIKVTVTVLGRHDLITTAHILIGQGGVKRPPTVPPIPL